MPQQIIGILDYIPSAQETKSLQNYIDEGKDISLLCECEKFMVAIMSVKEAKRKMEVMLFKLRFPSALNELMIGTFYLYLYYQGPQTLNSALLTFNWNLLRCCHLIKSMRRTLCVH